MKATPQKSIPKTCRQCQAPFTIMPEDLAFYDQISPVFGGKKQAVPPPTLCPDCRLQQRMAFRNERSLYNRKCDFTGKNIISMHTANKPLKVYDQDAWWGDGWDGKKYGRDFDFTRTFAEQFRELYNDVPHISLYTTNVNNSYYTNYALNLKNCYLTFGSTNNEDCLYGKFITGSSTCMDMICSYSCELCYEGIESSDCYNCKFFTYSRSCSDSIMIEDCQSCKNCIGCFGLRSKEYYVFNEYVGKEKFLEIQKEYEYLTPEKITTLQKKLNDLKAKLPHIQSHIYQSEDCTGDMIIGSRNCHNTFTINNCENCKHMRYSPKGVSSYDVIFTSPEGVQFSYNVCSSMGTSLISTFLVWYSNEVLYSMEVAYSSNLFGCVGLKKEKYCILNKQYTQEEYEQLVPKIIEHMRKTGEWGEYLAYQNSAFAYNETIAQEYFPLTEVQAKKLGTSWYHEDTSNRYKGPAVAVPADIRKVEDDITGKILSCQACQKNYKIIPQELSFYRKMKLPIPLNCFDCRHKKRVSHQSLRLYTRQCAKCQATMESTYAPTLDPTSAAARPEIVYCQACYLKEVY